MDFVAQLPHSYQEGTDIYPHIHWCPTTANGGTVIWRLDHYWLNINGTIPVLAQTDVQIAVSGVAWQHLMTSFPVIAGVGKTISSMLICRIWRNPATDSYPDDAGLLEVDFHFQLDSCGSRQEAEK